MPCAPQSPQKMYDEIFAVTEGFNDPDLKLITQHLLKENKEALMRWPAALKLHHAMRGGLLYHTLTMLESAKAIIGVYKRLYPSLSSEFVYAGIILHDIAKTRELVVGELGLASAYSTEGQLLGHLDLGMAMIERAAAELMIPTLTEAQMRSDSAGIRRAVSSLLKLCAAFSVAAALILWRFGGALGEAVYGSAEAGRFIRLLAPLVPIMYTDMVVDGCLKGLGQQVWSMGINILDAALGVVLVWQLLPIGALTAYIGIIYFNECLNFALSAARLHRAVKKYAPAPARNARA